MKYLSLYIFSFLVINSVAGQTYWQQHLDVKLDVTLDDKHHFLNGYEEIVYTNNSHDTLHYIYMHLWPNAYKHDHTPFAKQLDRMGNTNFYYSKASEKGYIDSLQFAIDGKSADYYSTDAVPDIARIDLSTPLLPGGRMTITTPFRVKIPKVFSRMGHTGQAYYISQWFPKPAVYDRKGWHPISYLDQGEFYSEFGTYDVNITVPDNYIVMATGNCNDMKEMSWLDELSKKPLPKDTLYQHSFPASSITTKTLHYHEFNVHDFAWFADKRWIVRKDTVYSPGTGRLVTAWAAFLPQHSKYWQHATDYLKETVKHYGKWVGPYEYETIKAVEGDLRAGGGMEYPTVTVIDKGAGASAAGLRTVVIHEAGHNWFYGMLGSNERDHAWMDEGINTFYEQKTTAALKAEAAATAGKKPANGVAGLDETTLYYQSAATHTDQAIDQTSDNFTSLNYGLDVYYKTSLMLKWLQGYMGDAFDRGMQAYYATWRFKHPYPEDFENTMQQHTDKQLEWFFDTVMNNNKRVDFTVKKVYTHVANPYVLVRNNTGIYSPVNVDVYDKDSLIGSYWSPPFKKYADIELPKGEWTTIKISADIPDGKTTNNEYRRYALFHRFGIKLKPFIGTNLIDKNKIFISPALGFNQSDGFMLGLLFHNLTIPENRFRFAVAPMYAFGSNTVVGTGSIGYVWYPENVFKEIMLQGDAKTFDYDKVTDNTSKDLYARYVKAAPSLNFTFNEHNPLSTVTRSLLLKGYYIIEGSLNHGDSVSVPGTLPQQEKVYGLLRYTHKNNRTYNPFGYSLEGQMGADFAKVGLEGNVRIDYNVKKKSLYVRAYLGKFFAINNDPSVAGRYYLNASYTGIDDYLYDDTYIGRTGINTLGAQQISLREGGFKIPTYNNVDRSDNWMAAINLKTDLPLGRLPIQLFLDAGLIPNANPSQTDVSNTKIMYDAGIEVYLLKDVLQLYLPVLMSKDFDNYLTDTYGRKNVFARSISFNINLQNINWLKAPEGGMRLISK